MSDQSNHGRIWAPELTPVRPTPQRRKGHGRKVHPHECYLRAGLYLLAQPDGVMVHANVGKFGVHHAWVELPEGLAYDGVDAALYPVDGYRAAIGVNTATEQRFTLAEWASRAGEVWGPIGDDAG